LLQGGQRHADFIYPDHEWFYYRFADLFGWTPAQVDELPAGQADWLLAIADTVEQVKVEQIEKQHR
jgi:hypothetical protein